MPDIRSSLRKISPIIWDSRAPYASFLKKHERLNKYYRITRVAYDRLEKTCLDIDDPDSSLDILESDIARQETLRDLKKLQKVTKRIGDLESELKHQKDAFEESILVKISSLFEAFVKCWGCNMLLAEIDQNASLSNDQESLLIDLIEKGRIPSTTKDRGWKTGISQIIDAFPSVVSSLEMAPRMCFNYATGKEVKVASSKDEGALRIVNFWQAFRNQVVHSDRIADRQFRQRNLPTWEILKSDLNHTVDRFCFDLEENKEIPLNEMMVTLSFATHASLAKTMQSELIEYSNDKRGHAFAPNPYRGRVPPEEMPSILPGLLLPGERSYTLATKLPPPRLASKES
jgi:hypothetical protein